MKRYDDIKDMQTPEEIKEFREEFSQWLVEFATGIKATCDKVDNLEEDTTC